MNTDAFVQIRARRSMEWDFALRCGEWRDAGTNISLGSPPSDRSDRSAIEWFALLESGRPRLVNFKQVCWGNPSAPCQFDAGSRCQSTIYHLSVAEVATAAEEAADSGRCRTGARTPDMAGNKADAALLQGRWQGG